jgi:glycosyltransferase involved in cell wall biosynthesis
MKLISFCIPIFNNQETIDVLYEKIRTEFDKLPEYEFEIVFTNDGSIDESLSVLRRIHEKDKRIKIINLSRNFGQVVATIASQRLVKGDAVITLSADLQDPLELIPKMIESWASGNEIVICKRIKRNDGIVSDTSSRLLFWFLKVNTNHEIPEGGFDYYLLDKKALHYLNLVEDRTRLMHIDIFELGFKKDFIPYERLKREFGKSQYSFLRRFSIFYNTFYTYSRFPIRLMIFMGFLFFLFGITYSISLAYNYIFYKAPFEGWTPIMILISISGGLILMMLGIIGEYIWRIYQESKKRPHYIIKDIYDDNSK